VRNFFQECETDLYLLKDTRSHKVYESIYRRTRLSISRYAYTMIRRYQTPIFDSEDCSQEGFLALWRRIPDFKFVCRCNEGFSCRDDFEAHTFDEHRGIFNPKNSISEFASYIVVGYMSNFRQSWLGKKKRCDYLVDRRVDISEFKFFTWDVENHILAKDKLRSIKELMKMEKNHEIASMMEGFLIGFEGQDLYRYLVKTGACVSQKQAKVMVSSMTESNALDAYRSLAMD